MRLPSGKGAKGSRTARRDDVGEMKTECVESGTPGVGANSGFPAAKPDLGKTLPLGGLNWKRSPEGVGRVSVRGLKVVVPA